MSQELNIIDCHIYYDFLFRILILILIDLFTWNETESLAAKAKISAQDTIPAHSFSTADLISSTTSKPDKDRFGIAAFSAVLFAVEFNSTDPSQPCKKFH